MIVYKLKKKIKILRDLFKSLKIFQLNTKIFLKKLHKFQNLFTPILIFLIKKILDIIKYSLSILFFFINIRIHIYFLINFINFLLKNFINSFSLLTV